MEFIFSRHNLNKKEEIYERIFEIIPGLTSWIIIIGMVLLSLKFPLYAAVIIIAFDLYWILRLFYMNIFLMISFFRLSIEENTDWMALTGQLDRLKRKEGFEQDNRAANFREKIAYIIHQKQLNAIKNSDLSFPFSEDIYHLVIIPVVNETREIIEPGIKSLSSSDFPAKRILVILALEEAASEILKNSAKELINEYQKYFFDLLVITHPSGLSGEAKVKGANVTYAARKAQDYFKEKDIPFENIIVSCFDADTVVNKNYFACLSYYFLSTPFRAHASFQPIPVYNNNIWEAPGFSRVLDIGSSFFQLIEATNQEKLVTFSSHSMSFKALVEIGFWPVDIISDDSAIFWKAFLYYQGNYHVVPMYTTVSMDVTVDKTWVKTFVNVYKQKRRWAWGVENFPIVMRGFMKTKSLSLIKRIKLGFKLFEGHIAWATWPFLLAVIGWLPALFASREFNSTTVYYNAPRITATIFRLASLGLVICIVLSLFLLPRKKVKHNILKRIGHTLEWLFVPLVSVFLSGLPALDAQTRLMLGKYLEFWVTPKKRQSH